jgi:hypothetical protein
MVPIAFLVENTKKEKSQDFRFYNELFLNAIIKKLFTNLAEKLPFHFNLFCKYEGGKSIANKKNHLEKIFNGSHILRYKLRITLQTVKTYIVLLSELFSGFQAAFGAIFRISCSYLKDGTSFPKKVTG